MDGYVPPGCDRHLMVKYAEDQHNKKDRRGQMGGMVGGPQGQGMSGLGIEGQLKQDPYFYSRSRLHPGMYRNQQSPLMQMGHNSIGNQVYLPSSQDGYPSSRGIGKNMGSSSMSPSTNSTNSLDWYGQMPQMVYDSQLANAQHMNSQHHGYDQQLMDQHMMTHSQSQQRSGHGQQGTVFVRSPRAAQEPGYSGSVTLIIGCLPQHADVALLHDLCAPYGRIIGAQIDMDNNNVPEGGGRGGCSGRGRVQMAGLSQAQYATQALNGAIIFEGGRPLQVKSIS
jgi:hypothetical protein